MTAATWPPAVTSGDDLADLHSGISHAFGDDPDSWDAEIRELYELARITQEVAT